MTDKVFDWFSFWAFTVVVVGMFAWFVYAVWGSHVEDVCKEKIAQDYCEGRGLEFDGFDSVNIVQCLKADELLTYKISNELLEKCKK